MTVEILCAGKLKESFYTDAAAEYLKRLSRYCKAEITEVTDGPDPAHEYERFLPKIREDAYVITLEIEGKPLSSVEFADRLESLMGLSKSRILFIIGGSDGLDRRICDRAHMHLSFSKMTFPHQLMRIILLEQIYRAFRIIRGEPYHK